MRVRQYDPNPEKPYELIPFAKQGVKRESPDGHHALKSDKLTGRMKIYLFPRVPIQVASGRQVLIKRRGRDEVVAEQSAIEQYGQEGKIEKIPILPGSSLKGMLRHLVETLSPSCVLISSGKTRFAIPNTQRRCTQIKKLCPACRLFGMSGAGEENYLGQISIEDAILQRGKRIIAHTPLLWTPARGRSGLPYRYLDGKEAKGRKLYYHSQPAEGADARMALKSGSQLMTWLHFENLSPGELGLLITAWGLHPAHPFLPKIGAAKPVGRGTIEVYLDAVEVYGNIQRTGRFGSKTELYRREQLETKIQDWVKSADEEGLLLNDSLEDVLKVLKSENLARSPVEGMY